jgi:Uma2 family endonuclease
MAVRSLTPHVSVEEYLRSSYEPDCDYVNGRLEERNLGEFDHARVQGLIYAWLFSHEQEWGIVTLPEQRVQVSASRYRVPDICVLGAAAPREQIILTPPLICIEVLSPEDRLNRAQLRAFDYVRMGVPNVWLVDPGARKGYAYRDAGWVEPEDATFSVAGTPIRVRLSEIFGRLG